MIDKFDKTDCLNKISRDVLIGLVYGKSRRKALQFKVALKGIQFTEKVELRKYDHDEIFSTCVSKVLI